MADNGRFGIVGIGKFTNTDEEQSWQVEGAVKYASLRIDIVHWVMVVGVAWPGHPPGQGTITSQRPAAAAHDYQSRRRLSSSCSRADAA